MTIAYRTKRAPIAVAAVRPGATRPPAHGADPEQQEPLDHERGAEDGRERVDLAEEGQVVDGPGEEPEQAQDGADRAVRPGRGSERHNHQAAGAQQVGDELRRPDRLVVADEDAQELLDGERECHRPPPLSRRVQAPARAGGRAGCPGTAAADSRRRARP